MALWLHGATRWITADGLLAYDARNEDCGKVWWCGVRTRVASGGSRALAPTVVRGRWSATPSTLSSPKRKQPNSALLCKVGFSLPVAGLRVLCACMDGI